MLKQLRTGFITCLTQNSLSSIRALLLAAGYGTRLYPLTEHCAKCLMPIGGRPLLEYWFHIFYKLDVKFVVVNLHHQRHLVETFLRRPYFAGWIQGVVEDSLLGTAGTLRENADEFTACTTLLVHADNWVQCDFRNFLNFHQHHRPAKTVITMMTFQTSSPESCGIVELDENGVVYEIHEKVVNPPGILANGAVYLLEPEVVQWVKQRPQVVDFSTEVLPEFLGRIATWENIEIHRDIGTVQSLLSAQSDPQSDPPLWLNTDQWMVDYRLNPVHGQLIDLMELI